MSTETDVYNIDVTGAVSGLRGVADATAAVNAKQESLASFMRSDLQNAFFSASAQYDLLKSAARGLFNVVKDGVHAYNESVMVSMRLDMALKNAGVSSVAFRERLDAQATALERLTGAEDEEILQLHTMLLAMGVAPEMIERVTAAALDMTAATGQSATNAARMMARASAEGKEELKKFGITVKDTANEAEGFQATLLAVEKRFGGVAAQIPEQIQHVNQLKGAWNQLSESIGQATMETVSFGGTSNILVVAMDFWSEALTRNKQAAALALSQAAALKAVESEFVAGMNKLLKMDAQPNDDKAGKRDLGTVPAFDVSKYAKEQEAKYLKAMEKEQKAWSAHAQRRAEIYKAAVDKEDAMRDEAQRQAQADREAEQKVMDDERAFELQRAELAKNSRLAMKKAEDEKMQELRQADMAKQREMAEYSKSIAEGALQFAGSIIKQAILADNAYTRAKKEQLLAQMTAGKTKQEADKIAHETQIGWQQEAEAALAKQTAAVLADIAIQAGIKAIWELAEGVAAVASGYGMAKAAPHFYAAALYGGIAGASGGAAYALSSNRGMTSDEKASLAADRDTATKNRNEREAAQGAQRGSSVGNSVNVYYLGITGQTEAQQGAELERIRAQYQATKTGGI